MSSPPSPLRRQLGLAAVMAVVMGDMMGSGIFFTPGELASIAQAPWQVYFIWTSCGLIVLCGALTLAELASLLPRPGATYHIVSEGVGPFWGFVKVWMETWVSLPGSVASIAIVFGEFVVRFLGQRACGTPPLWGATAVIFFAAINLLGVRWGGRTQIALTAVKILGVLSLIGGSLLLADPASSAPPALAIEDPGGGLLGFVRFVGLGVAAVLFTYDGWTDVTHVAGEVAQPRRHLPLGLALGVAGILLVYLAVNYSFLRVVPLEEMRDESRTVATTVALRSFGPLGGQVVNGLIMLSIFGALGGAVMTLPRLVYAGAARYREETRGRPGSAVFRPLAFVSRRAAVPAGAIVFCAAFASLALFFFGTFSRLVNYIVVPLQITNILTVAAIFRLRRRARAEGVYLTPGYPVVPLVFILVMALLLASAILYNPIDTLIGVVMTAAGAPVYYWIKKGPSA